MMLEPLTQCRHCRSRLQFSDAKLQYLRCSACLHDYVAVRFVRSVCRVCYLPAVDRYILLASILAFLLMLPRASVSYDYLRLLASVTALLGFQVYAVEAYYSLRSGVGPSGSIIEGNSTLRQRAQAKLVFGCCFLITPISLFL
jgi:hypothetical protein